MSHTKATQALHPGISSFRFEAASRLYLSFLVSVFSDYMSTHAVPLIFKSARFCLLHPIQSRTTHYLQQMPILASTFSVAEFVQSLPDVLYCLTFCTLGGSKGPKDLNQRQFEDSRCTCVDKQVHPWTFYCEMAQNCLLNIWTLHESLEAKEVKQEDVSLQPFHHYMNQVYNTNFYPPFVVFPEVLPELTKGAHIKTLFGPSSPHHNAQLALRFMNRLNKDNDSSLASHFPIFIFHLQALMCSEVITTLSTKDDPLFFEHLERAWVTVLPWYNVSSYSQLKRNTEFEKDQFVRCWIHLICHLATDNNPKLLRGLAGEKNCYACFFVRYICHDPLLFKTLLNACLIPCMLTFSYIETLSMEHNMTQEGLAEGCAWVLRLFFNEPLFYNALQHWCVSDLVGHGNVEDNDLFDRFIKVFRDPCVYAFLSSQTELFRMLHTTQAQELIHEWMGIAYKRKDRGLTLMDLCLDILSQCPLSNLPEIPRVSDTHGECSVRWIEFYLKALLLNATSTQQGMYMRFHAEPDVSRRDRKATSLYKFLVVLLNLCRAHPCNQRGVVDLLFTYGTQTGFLPMFKSMNMDPRYQCYYNLLLGDWFDYVLWYKHPRTDLEKRLFPLEEEVQFQTTHEHLKFILTEVPRVLHKFVKRNLNVYQAMQEAPLNHSEAKAVWVQIEYLQLPTLKALPEFPFVDPKKETERKGENPFRNRLGATAPTAREAQRQHVIQRTLQEILEVSRAFSPPQITLNSNGRLRVFDNAITSRLSSASIDVDVPLANFQVEMFRRHIEIEQMQAQSAFRPNLIVEDTRNRSPPTDTEDELDPDVMERID